MSDEYHQLKPMDVTPEREAALAAVWKYQTVKLDVSPQLRVGWLELGDLWNDEIAWATREMDEMFKDFLDEPRLGPTRADFDRIMAPQRRKQRLVAHIRSIMPGKRAGRFVR